MTDLEQQLTEHLRRRAAAASPRYDLEDVEQGVVNLIDRDLDDRRGRRSRRSLVAVCVVVAAVLTVGVLAALRSPDGDTTDGRVTSDGPAPEVPAPVAPPRFIPLPPEGATPSAPVNGVLLLSLQACGGPSSLPWSGSLAVYADGRLLWHTYEDPFEGDPSGGNGPRPTTGWLEQRLTPEGAELLRSELVSSGLLSPGQSGAYCPPDSYLADARIGDRNEYYLGELPHELVERIADPASWLPPSAWEDREVRPFVPASYAICVTGPGGRISISDIATALPPHIGGLVRARDWGEMGTPSGPGWFWCTGVATEDARTFAEALDAAGIERNEQPSAPGPEYLFDYHDTSRSELLHITFWPETPGGRVTD